MSTPVRLQHDPCTLTGIAPLLAELPAPVQVCLRDEHDPARGPLEGFIQHAFRRAYGAELHSFYPNLVGFSSDTRISATVGYRDGLAAPFFAEQYLDASVETLVAAHIGATVQRDELVEVGNLALDNPGEARWIIAAVTTFLHAAGYRWVLFTAVKPLFNAFQRLGLRPVQIAVPDPGRLPDGGRQWGSYYQAGPTVCVGDIEAGFRKLSPRVLRGKPRLHALMREAQRLGKHPCTAAPAAIRAAV